MPYRPFDRSREQDAELDRLLALGREAGAAGVVVLDVDGCLTDTRWRQLHIFRAWAEQTGHWGAAAVTVEHFEDRNLVRTLENAGVSPEDAAAWYPDLRRFWAERFFDDHHVELDLPMPGAARFVNALHDAGCRIAYLTGRHTTMRPAGERMFRRHGLPVGERASFVDKPDPRTEDHVHKLACVEAVRAMGDVVIAIDNEPINVNVFADGFPGARVVFVETDCSDRPVEIYEGVGRIRGFLRTTDRTAGPGTWDTEFTG